MNRLKGTVVNVETEGSVSLVDVEVAGTMFSASVLETPAATPFMAPGRAVWLLFKETEVSINLDFGARISLRNRIRSRVKEVELGKVLARLVLDFKGTDVVSIITARSVNRLGIKVGDEVEGMVKANEMVLMDGAREIGEAGDV